MASPLQISGLPPAGVALDSDVVLMRSGFTDYQCAVGLIRVLNLAGLSVIPTNALGNDKMLIERAGSNYQIDFNRVGLPANCIAVFYMGGPPNGWVIVNGAGGNLLAVTDTMVNYAGVIRGGLVAGTWDQTNATLTIDQIPAHSHKIFGSITSGNTEVGVRMSSAKTLGDLDGRIDSWTTGGNNSDLEGVNGNSGFLPPGQFPAANGHNHGNSWRPSAACCIICEKTG